jgi:hypothetical protein
MLYTPLILPSRHVLRGAWARCAVDYEADRPRFLLYWPCIKSRYDTGANLPLPGKVEAFQAMRPIVGNETGAAWLAPIRFLSIRRHYAPNSPGYPCC